MTRTRRSLCSPRDRGSSAVEFALVFPLMLLLLFGIIDFGRMAFERINVTAAAYEGARASGFKLGAVAITQAATAAAGGLDVIVFTTSPDSTNVSCAVAGVETTIKVSRTSEFQFFTPLFRGIHTKISAIGAFRCLG